MTATGASSGGVSVIRLNEDVPRVQAGSGVEVQHLVGQDLMFRLVSLAADASVPVNEPDQEHVVLVTSGTVRITQGHRDWELAEGSAAMVRAGAGIVLAAVGREACCQLASTPPNAALVRHLIHLEHADHGFD